MKYLSFILIWLTTPAFAFTLNSQTSSSFRGWSDPHIRFALNLSNCPAGVNVRGIIEKAADVWNNVATSRLELEIVGDTTSTTANDPITVICDTNYGSTDSGLANGSPGAASISPTSGDSIAAGIMYLNASGGNANIKNLSEQLVAVTLAHEFGHLLGLGHSQDTKALMYYDASSKKKLNLAQDDVDAVTYLYPRDELSGDPLAGCGRVSSNGPGASADSLVNFLFLLLPILALLLQRKLVTRAG